MANLNTPFGLQLYQRDGNADFRASAVKYYVPAGTTSALFQGDPVITVASSADSLGYNGVKLAAAGTSNRITGVITGFLGTGTPNPSFFGLSGTPGPAYKPASNSVAYYVLVTEDPAALYEVQANASVAATVVGKNANLVAGTGSTYTGWSGWLLDTTSIGTSSTLQVSIKGFAVNPQNAPGSANAKLLVSINQNTNVNATTGI